MLSKMDDVGAHPEEHAKLVAPVLPAANLASSPQQPETPPTTLEVQDVGAAVFRDVLGESWFDDLPPSMWESQNGLVSPLQVPNS